jgi:hypothetical protein
MRHLMLIALLGCVACAPSKVTTAADIVDITAVDQMLTGLSEPEVRKWLAQHCGPFEYQDRDALQRSKAHVSPDLLRECSGRFRALVLRHDSILKKKEGEFDGDVSLEIFMSNSGKVLHSQFEVLDDR